jgi:hypothetical protein
MIEKMQLVIAHYRHPNGGNIYVAGPVTDITTDTIYRDGKQLYPKGTTVYMVEANESVDIDYRGIVARVLTPNVIPFNTEIWKNIEELAEEADFKIRAISRHFYFYSQSVVSKSTEEKKP